MEKRKHGSAEARVSTLVAEAPDVAAPRANTQVNGKYYIHTTRRDYACFGSGGSSATTTEARDASRTTLSAPSPSSGSSSAFA